MPATILAATLRCHHGCYRMSAFTPDFEKRASALERSVVEKYFQCWNMADFGILDALLDEEWTDHAHPERHDAADVRRAFESFRQSSPGTRILVDAVLGQGELIEVNGRVVTEHTTASRVWIFRLVNNRLREMWTHEVD
jgi:hypothetical protein